MTTLDDASLYTIGWIAALPIERAAATALLDDRHGPPQGFEQHQSDSNSYTWGRIGAHNIVIASLPAGIYGTTSAAVTASNLLSSLPQIKIGLLVGIGGGVARPDQNRDIRLGDVITSQPQGTEGGVVQYDLGKAKLHETWERKGSLNMPPQVLLSALGNLQAEHEISPSQIPDLLRAMGTANPKMNTTKNNVPAFVHQGLENDRLFESTYAHQDGNTCATCDATKEVKRERRDTTDPEIHYGIIASGNKLIMDAALALSFSTLNRKRRFGASSLKLPLELLLTHVPRVKSHCVCLELEFNFGGKYRHGLPILTTSQSSGSWEWRKPGNLLGDVDRGGLSKLFSTVAAQLTEREPAIAGYVKSGTADMRREARKARSQAGHAAEGNAMIRRSFFQEKFNNLVLNPLEMVAPALRTKKPVMMVVDALDECEPEDDIRLLLELFSRATAMQSLQLKIFLTSRPKLRIRLGIQNNDRMNQELRLHRMSADGKDVAVFLNQQLTEMRDEYNASRSNDEQLAGDWPDLANVEALVKMAAPSFTSAATMCRFIADRSIGTPDDQLQRVLAPQRAGRQISQRGAAYLPILYSLNTNISEWQREKNLDRFRSIVGPFVVLATPLSRPSLARLLDLAEGEVAGQFDMLHSVVKTPSSATAPVKLIHRSFGEFILDAKQCTEPSFWIDGAKTHKTLAVSCLRVMECLRRDMCGTGAIRANRSTIGQRRIDACIPPEVQYACVYWVHHVKNAGYEAGIGDRVYSFLNSHRLHWMEALGLLGRGSEVVHSLQTLLSLFGTKHRRDKQLSEFLNSFMNFAGAMAGDLDSSPLQIYTARSGA
ncbi:hypothetical protein XA68_11800 [Ophiocordyceps unilateralis]|uniref:Nephrocystin 3-like N-terminal domain-containing protein n=1 Tax=Ophiocordyceps unilateralis TaxID=268505 RepID=A0A2A9PN46_OPHUN|nr:hypothetical protein XA68_11800 [Ophiocordyceps unilateralis]